MNGKSKAERRRILTPFLMLAALAVSMPLWAQVPVDEYGQPLPALEDDTFEAPAQGGETLGAAELEELVGPIALYPDDLLAIVLPASTYPLEIVQAARFLDELATDSSLEPDETWDESIVALLNYPEVVYMLDKEIDWTWRLGEAVINQQADVLAAVEAFRNRAYAAGNLESDERQTVSSDDGVIEIEPVDDEIIYVPYYEPEEVVVYQPRRVYYYYPYAYPVYYYPYPVGYSFASGYFWGVTTAFTIGWHNHYLHVYHPSYWGHPYYGRHYYGHWYRRPSITVYNHWYVHHSYRQTTHRYRDGDYWRPRARSGARPTTQRVRNYHNPSGERRGHRAGTRAEADVRQHVRNRDHARSDADRSRRSGSNAPIRRSTADRAGSSRDTANRASRQRLNARHTRENIVNTPAQHDRRTSRPAQRQTTTPATNATRTTRTSSRQVTGNSQARQNRHRVERAAAPRATRATRTSSRQVAPRQSVPAHRQTTPAATRRQSATPARATAPQRQSRRATARADRAEIRRTRPRRN